MVQTKWLPDFMKEELPPDVKGKVFVITGTTSGTGYVAAKIAAQLGGEVVMLNRESSRVQTMLSQLKSEVPDGKFVTVACDLQDFESVRKAAKEVKSKYSMIYCLANNAGIMAAEDKATTDGYDIQMQTNHLSHFLLTAELYPLLEASANETGDARIVNHSSGGRKRTPNNGLEEKYFQKNGGNLGGDEVEGFLKGPRFERYFQTKLANAVFNYGLHKKLEAKGSKVRAICCDPGASATNLANGLSFGFFTDMFVSVLLPFLAQSGEDGAMGLLKGMMGPDAKSGVHYGPQGNKDKGYTGRPLPTPLYPYEMDSDSLNMLWKTSEEATGVSFDV